MLLFRKWIAISPFSLKSHLGLYGTYTGPHRPFLFLIVSILAKSEKYSDDSSEQILVDEMDGNGCS